MSELKTRPTRASVIKYLKSVENEKRRADCQVVVKMMRELTGETPRLWGDSLIGFGSYHYKYTSGQEGDWPLTAVSPRKQNLVVYIMPGFERWPGLMKRLGKYRTGRSCLYINKLEDIHLPTLRRLIDYSVRRMRKVYGASAEKCARS